MAAWALWALALLGLATVPWFDHLARHPVGWLLLAVGLSVTGSGVADGYARYGLVARPGVFPAARWVATYSPATTIAGLALVGFVLLLTSSGKLPSPRWRYWAFLAAVGPVVFVVALTVGPGLVIPPYQAAVAAVTIPALAGAVLVGIVVGLIVTVVGLVVGAGSLVARFRRAHGVERQQRRWLALAAALTGVGAAVVGVGMAVGATAVPLFAAGVCLVLLPLATGDRLRQQVDLDTLTAELLAVVDQTMQPTSVSLWLRGSVGASPIHRNPSTARAAR